MQPCTQEEEQNSSPVLLDFRLLLELKKKSPGSMKIQMLLF